MEPVEEYNASNLFQQISSITDFYGYGSSTPAAEAYEAVMKEIMRMTSSTRQMDERELLKKLYPLEYAKLNSGLEAKHELNRNLLIELLLMNGTQMVRPLPSLKDAPAEAILRFTDFDYINVTDQVLEISMKTFKNKGKKEIMFGPSLENKLLFVESTKQYRGLAIPFMWGKLTKDTTNYVYASPQIFDDNSSRWTIKLNAV